MSPIRAFMTIGELARQTGASLRSIRHYDDNGLLTSGRADNGYRVFPMAAVTQVRQIQKLLAAGFSLADIRSFPECMRLIEGAAACPETGPVQLRRLALLDKQMAQLEQQRQALLQMLPEPADQSV